jgi:hypothetical protein
MTQYLVAIHHPDDYDPSTEDEAMSRDIDALNDEMVAAGVRIFVGGLSPANSARSLRAQPDGKVLITDGPYLETSVEPVLEILNLDDVSDFRMADLHGDCGQPAADVARPLKPVHCGEGLRHGFVERFRRHVQRMRSFVQIVDDDGAGLEEHEGNLSDSLFIRLISPSALVYAYLELHTSG